MLSGKAALAHPEVDALAVRPLRIEAAGTPGTVRRPPAGKRSGLRSLANAMSEQQRRSAGLRRNGCARRRR